MADNPQDGISYRSEIEYRLQQERRPITTARQRLAQQALNARQNHLQQNTPSQQPQRRYVDDTYSATENPQEPLTVSYITEKVQIVKDASQLC